MKLYAVAKRLVIISRPIFWLAALGVYGSGVYLSKSTIDWAVFAGLFYVTLPMGIIIYGLNDIADRESDAMNSRKGSVEGAQVSTKETRFLLWATGIAFVSSLLPFLLTRRYWVVLCMIGILLFAYTYSVKPLRLKTRPILDSLSNGFWVICIFLSGFFINAQKLHVTFPIIQIFIVIVCATFVFHALGAIVDYEVDKQAGDTTTAVVFGKRPALVLCIALSVLGAALSYGYTKIIASYFIISAVVLVAGYVRPAHRTLYGMAWALYLFGLAACGFVLLFGFR